MARTVKLKKLNISGQATEPPASPEPQTDAQEVGRQLGELLEKNGMQLFADVYIEGKPRMKVEDPNLNVIFRVIPKR